MKKTKINNQDIFDPYEDMLRLEKLDPYEALIKFKLLNKKNFKSIQ
tara:strand:+ start:567 stop:704 length:138 start_codon:yes stop_codon:yes gene_type:complete